MCKIEFTIVWRHREFLGRQAARRPQGDHEVTHQRESEKERKKEREKERKREREFFDPCARMTRTTREVFEVMT